MNHSAPVPFRFAAPAARILLVSDTPAMLAEVRSLIESIEHDPVEAVGADDAVQKIEASEFALIIIDVSRPGLSGFDTAHQILAGERNRHTPIAFFSTDELQPEEIDAGYILGAIEFFQKPHSRAAVQSKIRGLIHLYREKQRAKNEAEQLRMLIQGTTDYAIFMLDPHGHVATWNLGAERIKQYRSEEIIGQHFSKFYPQDALDRGWPEHELSVASAEGRFEDEGWRIRKDGSRFWANVVITALRDAQGALRGFLKVTRDLTERRLSEENSRRVVEETSARRVAEENARIIQLERERLLVTLSSIGDAVISTDAEGRVGFLNPVAEELVGWTTEEARGRPLEEVFRIINEDSREPVENPALRALRDGKIVGLANHTILISKDGRERPIDDSAAPIRDVDGHVIGSVLVFRDISERKRSEERLWLLANTIPQLAWMARPDGHIFWYNRRWYEYTGTTPEEMEGWGWQSVHDPRELPNVLERWKQSIATGEPFDMVFPLKGADGQFRQFLTRINPLRDEAGHIQYWFGTNTDITELRQAREALVTSEERLRLALDAGRMGVWDWDVRTGGLKWSPSLEPLHGLAPGTFGGTFDHFQKLIHPDDREAVNAAIREALETGGEFAVEFRNVWPSGSVHWIAGTGKVFMGSDGLPLRMIGIGLDITFRKRAEQTARFLADASAALAVLVDFDSTLQKISSLAVPAFADWVAVDVLEEDGCLRRVSVTHTDPAKVQIAHEIHRRFPPDREAPYGVWNIIRTGRPELVSEITDESLVQSVKEPELLGFLRELGLRSYIGVPLTVRGNTLGVITFINAESGHQYDEADLGVAQELASRAAIAIENAQLYRELREADQRKDEFLATLAHELRNPLAPIRNGLEVLKLAGGGDEVVNKARTMMERQLTQMVRLVDDLLDVSRITRNKLELRKERVLLADVVHSAVETSRPLMERAGHTFSLSLPTSPVNLDADLTRLAQVFSNLLNNSAKYTSPGGRVSLSGEVVDEQVVIRVQDNGVGIPADALPRIFDMFSQVDGNMERAQGGLGIGLTLVRRLVEMHGGTVEARSEGTGKGSEFIVRLPILPSEPRRVSSASTKSGPQSNTKRILVVDDNLDSATSLGMMLRLMGNDIQTAHDGLAAVERAEAFRPNVILLDIGLPKLNGYDVCRRIREQPWSRGVTIIALTGWGQEDDRRRSQEAGFDHHLVKPVEIATLKQLLAESTPT